MSDKRQAILILVLALVMLFLPPLNDANYWQGLAAWIPHATITYLVCLVAWCLIMLSQEARDNG